MRAASVARMAGETRKAGRSSRDGGTRLQSVARAAQVLFLVAARPDGCTAKEAANAFGVPLPTMYHLLGTLVAEGLLVRDASRRFLLGPGVGALGNALQRQLSVPEHHLDACRRLSELTHETTGMSAWRGDELQVVASVEGPQPLRVAGLHVGAIHSGHARATGKLLLAFAAPAARDAYLSRHPLEARTAHTVTDPAAFDAELARIAEAGVAYDVEEYQEAVSCVAAPLRDGDTVVAAITVMAPAFRFAQRRDELTRATLEVARDASSPRRTAA